MGAAVRLVKGAYNEPSEIAYPKKSDVDENYFHLAQRLLSPEARRAGVRAALATHDLKLIARISKWAAGQGIARNQMEFAMLYGIQRGEQCVWRRRIIAAACWFPTGALVSVVHAPACGTSGEYVVSCSATLRGEFLTR